jgi:IS5 family transposase
MSTTNTSGGEISDRSVQMNRRNLGDLRSLAADKGYGTSSLREYLSDVGIPPIIKHRILATYNHVHDERING